MAASAAGSRFTVLVLAGDRGPQDPVSQAAGVAHKCLAPVAGRTMLERVVTALVASPPMITAMKQNGRMSTPVRKSTVVIGAATTPPKAAIAEIGRAHV